MPTNKAIDAYNGITKSQISNLDEQVERVIGAIIYLLTKRSTPGRIALLSTVWEYRSNHPMLLHQLKKMDWKEEPIPEIVRYVEVYEFFLRENAK